MSEPEFDVDVFESKLREAGMMLQQEADKSRHDKVYSACGAAGLVLVSLANAYRDAKRQ